jgi:hypothetical protein
MKLNSTLTLLTFIIISSLQLNAQDFQWAFTGNKIPLTRPSGIKQDHTNNFYLATNVDSAAYLTLAQLDKFDENQQLIWNRTFNSGVGICDLEITADNHVVLAGIFNHSLIVDTNVLFSSGNYLTTFIMELDENGALIWMHEINPVNEEFKPVDLFIANDGSIYFTSEINGVINDFTSFHKLDANGNLLLSEFNNNTEVRTYSHILVDDEGNIFLSGTCGNFASFDGIAADPNASYQNYIIGYDSTFTAQWLITKPYITFDHNNKLATDGQNLFWVYDDFSDQNSDSIMIRKIDKSGNELLSLAGPMSSTFFPVVDFSMDSSSNSTLLIEAYTRYFLYRYDNSFNIVWQDTLLSGTSGYPNFTSLICYDSTFYFASYYYSDTMVVGSTTLLNPNQGANSPADVFVTKWGYGLPNGISSHSVNNSAVSAFPNPASNQLFIRYDEKPLRNAEAAVVDHLGRVVFTTQISSGTLDLSNLASGMYFVKCTDSEKSFVVRFVKQ